MKVSFFASRARGAAKAPVPGMESDRRYTSMNKQHQDQIWVPHSETVPEAGGEGVVRRVLAYSKDVMCVENTFETGAVGALHSHPHTQITYVVSGEFDFTIEGETKTVRAGDTMLKLNGVEHGRKKKKAGILLDIFNPMREDFV